MNAPHGRDLGPIDMHSLDEGIKREDVSIALDGNIVLALEEAISVKPIYTLKGKMYHSAVRAILMMGTRNDDVVQNQATGATTTVTARLGFALDLPAIDITLTSITVGGVGKMTLRDTAFFIEENKGIIRFPEVAAGIADGASVVLTYNKKAVTREAFTMFNRLNEAGVLKLYKMDTKSSIPYDYASLPGTLSRDKGTDGDPAKHDQWSMRFALNGQPTALMRAA